VYSAPPQIAQSAYTEKLIYLPGTWLFNDLGSHRSSDIYLNMKRRVRAPSQPPHFCNFGRPDKYDPDTMQQWCAILRQVPHSTLSLWSTAPVESLRGWNCSETLPRYFAQECGLDASRILLTTTRSWTLYMQSMVETCDVVLDTPNYNHGATALEVLFARVPLVHMAGAGYKLMSRAAGSVIRAAGLYDELVVHSWPEYVSKAVELALNATTASRIRAKLDAVVLEDSKASVLFRPQVDVAHLFAGLREAYRVWTRGDAPKHIFTHPLATKNRVSGADYAKWFGDGPAPAFELVHERDRVYPHVASEPKSWN
jgi:predicted O-linked N-acetylglucosamine transferase (SPINDLY family)